MVDLGAMYRDSRERVTVMVIGADPALPVPATPGWTVHDIVAHLAGLAEDVANDNMGAAPSEAWTAAHVERGRDKTVDELLHQWDRDADGLETFLSSPGGAAASAALVDVNAHEADLRHALGLPPAPDDEFVAWAAPILRAAFVDAVERAGLEPVAVEVSDEELLRSRLGRRTADEACALGWSADPHAYLDTWFLFGPRGEPLGEDRW